MKRNMNQWVEETIQAPIKKPMPVLSFPAIQYMGITVRDFISSSDLQAEGMKIIADKADTAASLGLMDLSVEAECFGSVIHFSDEEVPTVVGSIISSPEEAAALQVPQVGSGRTQIYIDAVKKAVALIEDRPVFGGAIGPFSLTGRLLDVTEAMFYCIDEPEMVHTVLDKTTEFIIDYCREFKKAGANGVVLAEPLAGILSPALAEEFSSRYVKRIIDEVQDESFLIVYHNCGDNAVLQVKPVIDAGCKVFHFGNAIEMAQVMWYIPEDVIACGNIDPVSQFRYGTPESIRKATSIALYKCSRYSNFIISSGCDIPPLSNWDNIHAFFDTVEEFYTLMQSYDVDIIVTDSILTKWRKRHLKSLRRAS